ncbi:MAG: pyridoxal phosphate-dependent aminotransferase [Candidatus Eisenbacteria bacterium]|uniref:Aminotransferase n=1 Tax=Eiseniibacteriota bacterium TaxID=2212470 RepID=A0A7Y2E8T0_UNCEI|nr:pyridoxal phosphate-dependent aminotransferase [Candidatus Eisenbacteria bacterium]
MTHISERLSALGESLTLAVDGKVQELTAQGKDIVNLSAGQPDFNTPDFVCEAAVQAMKDGQTRYTPPGGTPALRAEGAKFFSEMWQVPATAANTVVTCGAKHAIYDALFALIEPGDEVIIPVPYWVSYPEQVKLVGGVPKIVVPSQGLRVTPEDLEPHVSSRTKLLIFNSPSNPTGQVYAPNEVRALVAWCLKHNVMMLSDEIYNRLLFGSQTALSPASVSPEAAAKVITINGVSKSHAMTGWRIGIMTGPEDMMKAITKFQGQTTGNPSSVSQAAALAALQGPDEVVAEMCTAYERRRDFAVDRLNQIAGVSLEKPEGAFYAFPKIADAASLGGSVALAAQLVEHGVAAVPGAGFGADDHIRISFALGDDRLAEGLDRLEKGLAHLKAAIA